MQSKLVTALRAIEPLLENAKKAYQFSPTSYTYEALLAIAQARDLARAAIEEHERAEVEKAAK
jgi:hypothetical protein